MSSPEGVEASCGNVFADIGLDDPEELLLQADLALAIRRTIQAEGRTEVDAAKAMGLTPKELSLVLDYPFDTPAGQLFAHLNRLGQNVEIVVSPAEGGPARVTVRGGGRERTAA